MKKLFFCLSVMALVTHGYAQNKTNQGLQIGDTVPNVFFGECLQGNFAAKSLADFKGRLTILDFWSTGCLGCILGMPHMDSLQQTFGDQIQTIIICENDRQDVERLFKAVRKPFPKTPIILEDSILNAYFPHVTVPHHVWIDEQGVVKFITYDHNATVENVRKFLHHEPLHLSFRKQLTDYDNDAILYTEGNGRWNKQIKYHTLFATYLEGVEHTDPQVSYDTSSNTQTLRVVNYPYRYLFMVAYNYGFGDGLYLQKSRWIVETRDTDNFLSDIRVDSAIDQWNRKYIASYEVVLPGSNRKDLFKAMQRDLNTYSPYFAKIEKRKVKCLILVNKGIRPSTYRAQDSVYVEEANKSWVAKKYTINNSVFSQLVNGNHELVTPIIDETGFQGKADFKFSTTLGNLEEPVHFATVQKELNENGLGLEYGYRTVDMLVIRDKHN